MQIGPQNGSTIHFKPHLMVLAKGFLALLTGVSHCAYQIVTCVWIFMVYSTIDFFGFIETQKQILIYCKRIQMGDQPEHKKVPPEIQHFSGITN